MTLRKMPEDGDLFEFAASAAALRCSVDTLRTWYKRGQLSLQPDDATAPRCGLGRGLSIATIKSLAIAIELHNRGLRIDDAFFVAQSVMRTCSFDAKGIYVWADGNGGWLSDLTPLADIFCASSKSVVVLNVGQIVGDVIGRMKQENENVNSQAA